MKKEVFKPGDKGYFLVRKCSRVKIGWRLVYEVSVKGNQKKQKTIPKSSWEHFGFSESMTYEAASERRTQLNKQNQIKRKAQRKVISVAGRIEAEKLIESAYIPRELGLAFQKHLKKSSFGSDQHIKKLQSQWKFVQNLISELKIDVQDISDSDTAIYKYFISKKISYNYVSKLIRILNMWGSFVSKSRDCHYETLAMPRGRVKQRINDAYSKSKLCRAGGARALTLSDLVKLKEGLSHLPGQYEWMAVSLWFGLRPSEVSSLIEGETYRIESHKEDKSKKVLWVYQEKLQSIDVELRWKPIPVICPEQVETLSFIRSGLLKKPLNKTIQRVLEDKRFGAYSGRKGFTDLLMSKNQKIENISIWLGHSTIETTWKHYKDKKVVNFDEVEAS